MYRERGKREVPQEVRIVLFLGGGMKFRIEGAFFGEKCFPGLNDLLHEAERHPQAYNRMKRQYQMVAVNAIRRDLRG